MTTNLALLLLVLLPGPDDGFAPWGMNKQAGDAPKQHQEDVTRNKQGYTVVQGGTMDGRSCRTPLGCGMSREGAMEQTWESNRFVRMENVGDADVVNPWLSNGQNPRNLEEVIAAAVVPGMTDAEKATGLWYQRVKYRYHYSGGDAREEGDILKTFHIYGYNTCGSDSMMLSGAWKQVGLKSAPARGVGHCISQVFYDGKWHLFDGDLKAVYLNRDNETVAGEQDIVRDHDLIKRSHTQGILMTESVGSQEGTASIYGFEGEVKGQRDCYKEGSLQMTLRPGEALVWRWGHATPARYFGSGAPLYPNMICNGLWEYRPDFSKEIWRKGAAVDDGVRSTPAGLSGGTITWTLKAPYVMVGGRLAVEGVAEFEVSFDGKTWEKVADFDKAFAYKQGAPAKYGYQLRCSPAGLKSLAIVNDLQMAPLALPEMAVGKNEFKYTDESASRKVRITHDWVERSASKPPQASASAVYPPEGGESDGTDFVFKWAAAADPDGDKVVDYHFELSNRADLRWPLSMGFTRMISRTADAGKAQYTLRTPGLLTGDRKYYWHVRAKDEKGLWGPWSTTWTFTAKAPNHPVEVAVSRDKLTWKPNPSGRRAAAYRVYGSDERGFTVSDQPTAVSLGVCKELSNPFPASFLAETKTPEFPLRSAPVRSYYRVVAVDDKGKRSGPSDFAELPRPVIYSKASETAKNGAPFRHQILASRSIGDLRSRQVGGRDTASYWDIERLKYEVVKGPEWLKLDPATGLLTGTPTSAGTFDVQLVVVCERDVRTLDGDTLAWGNEKVVSTSVERVGEAKAMLTIVVER